jgi:hypothetical protein
MQDASRWQVPLGKASHAFPVQAVTLAATSQRLEPVSGDLDPESQDRREVAWHGVVGEMSSHYAGQPSALLGDGQMPASLELVFDLSKFGPHPFLDRGAPKPEASAPALPADVREAQEVERFGLAESTLCPVRGGVPPELDQAWAASSGQCISRFS